MSSFVLLAIATILALPSWTILALYHDYRIAQSTDLLGPGLGHWVESSREVEGEVGESLFGGRKTSKDIGRKVRSAIY